MEITIKYALLTDESQIFKRLLQHVGTIIAITKD